MVFGSTLIANQRAHVPQLLRQEWPATTTARLNTAFLNVPYDKKYENLYLAFIAGLCAFGLTPRATVEIPGSERRLNRILNLIRSYEYSFHDLSRVELDRNPPSIPRFNMPFELGLAVALAKTRQRKHLWYAFEAANPRLSKSLRHARGAPLAPRESSPIERRDAP